MGTNAKERLNQLISDFWISSDTSILTLTNPSPVEFLRECVSSYSPCILKNMTDDWPAYQVMDIEYLLSILGSKEIKVNFTIDGRADSVQSIQLDPNKPYENRFIYPLCLKIPFSKFYSMLMHPHPNDAVPYLSEQNNNFQLEFQELADLIPTNFPLSSEAFGLEQTDAVNLWIGDERSVSSLHKDHYEVSRQSCLHTQYFYTLSEV